MNLKMSSETWRPFYLDLSVLTYTDVGVLHTEAKRRIHMSANCAFANGFSPVGHHYPMRTYSQVDHQERNSVKYQNTTILIKGNVFENVAKMFAPMCQLFKCRKIPQNIGSDYYKRRLFFFKEKNPGTYICCEFNIYVYGQCERLIGLGTLQTRYQHLLVLEIQVGTIRAKSKKYFNT